MSEHMHHTGNGGHEMQSTATKPQIAVVGLLTILALVVGVAIPANRVNLSLSKEDVGGLIMPPGMPMTNDTPGEAMREMAAVKSSDVAYTAPDNAQGDRTLQPKVVNGVKEYTLEASVIRWTVYPGQRMLAYAFNRQVPGPRIRVTEGDRLRIRVVNHLPETTTVHWHGLLVPNAMDGPAHITQKPIPPGGSFTYEFTVGQAGTYMYHSHDNPDRQQALGLYGALIIDPKDPARDAAYR
ncbi:MAG TPA: multicopper oxidase domain-containing protein, partial [Mycobacterium sp.]|nr:multicopper oxidase domain-containing protein [Mycobacterium sp.]